MGASYQHCTCSAHCWRSKLPLTPLMGLSEWLEYNTIKVVRVKSVCLGLLHYSFIVAIALYLGLYVFYYQKRYLHVEAPAGLQRITIQDPCDPIRNGDECTIPHLKGTPAMGQTCFIPKAFRCSRHEYCKQNDTAASEIHTGPGGKLTCRYWDHNSMVWPPAERGAFTTASRASLIEQELLDVRSVYSTPSVKKKCDAQTNMNCQWFPPVIDHSAYAAADAYMADLGNFTIRISHSTWAPSSAVSANSGDMEGEIMKCNHGADCNLPSSWASTKKLPKTGGADLLLMRDILYAATPHDLKGVKGPGMDLDMQSDACPRKCSGKPSTYRYMGLVLHATIVYDNTGTLIKGSSTNNIKYQYKFFVKPKTKFSVQVVQKGSNPHKRTIHHLFGPRVVFDAGGKLGFFQFNSLVIQLTTSLAMFALATTIVDVLMLYVLPNREKYELFKYQDIEGDAKLLTKNHEGRATIPHAEVKDAAWPETDGPEFPPGM